MIYGVARISTKKQNIERQVRNINLQYPSAKIIKETYTGTKLQGRKEFENLLKILKAHDTLVFDSISRMSRNSVEGCNLYEKFMQNSYPNIKDYTTIYDIWHTGYADGYKVNQFFEEIGIDYGVIESDFEKCVYKELKATLPYLYKYIKDTNLDINSDYMDYNMEVLAKKFTRNLKIDLSMEQSDEPIEDKHI